jgi:hypothetical protein
MTRLAVRRGSKVLCAATIAAVAASIAPAQAIVGTPVPLGNSVPNGFTKRADVVAVSYNVPLDALASTVSVTDVNGDPVNGSFTVTTPSEKTLAFTPLVANQFNEDLSPYTATFTARAQRQAAATASSVVVLNFDVDFIIPFQPDVKLNDGAAVGPVISAPGEDLIINGKAVDTLSEAGIVSGVKQVDVHFYNPLANPTQLTLAGAPEVNSMHRTITMPCTGGCNALEDLSIDISDLPLGYWNIKVSVTDAAGNKSAQSAPMSVLKLAAGE